MAINTCTTGNFHFDGAVARNQGGLNFNIVHRTNRIFNTGYIQTLQEPNYAGWALGTGVPIDVTGAMIYNEANGALCETRVSNKGPSTVYIGFNNTAIAVNSGLSLASGETYHSLDGTITKIWAISNGGVGIVVGYGRNEINLNTI